MNTKKQTKVKYSPDFEKQVKELRGILKEKNSKFHRQLLIAIERAKDNLLIDSHYGIQIKKKFIPNELIKRYSIINLWKINLPNHWRMIYTITGNELEIISILLEFMDHKDYNKLFGYKNK